MAPVVLGILLLVVAGAIAIDLAGWVDVSVTAVLAVMVIAIGIGLVVSAFVGGGGGLIALGLLTTLALGVAAVTEPAIDRGVGEERYAPATLIELEERYEHGFGKLVLDLRDLDLEGESRDVEVDLVAGEAIVILPPDVAVDLRADTTFGETDVLGRTEDGIGNEIEADTGGDPEEGRLGIDLDVRFGRAEVRRG